MEEEGEEEEQEESVPEDAAEDTQEIILPSPQKLPSPRHSLASTSQALPPSEQEFQEAAAAIQDFVIRGFHKAAENWMEDRDWNNAEKRKPVLLFQ